MRKYFPNILQDFVDNMVPALFAVIATFLASIFAVIGVIINIKSQNDLESQRIENRLIAYRASLPIALSELVRICKIYVLSIKRGVNYGGKESMVVSEASRETIREVIQNSDEVIKQELSNLLAYYQFAESEYNSLANDSKTLSGSNKLDTKEANLIMLWVSLKTLTESYFSYGRGEKFEKNPIKDHENFKEELRTHARKYQKKLFSKYLNSRSVEGCGFLDPNYFKKEGQSN